jgi:hypothetical protein
VADHRDRFAGLHKGPGKGDGFGIPTEEVRVGDSTRQDQSVVVLDTGTADR